MLHTKTWVFFFLYLKILFLEMSPLEFKQEKKAMYLKKCFKYRQFLKTW